MFEKIFAIPKSFVSSDGKKLNFAAYLFLILLCIGFFTPGIISMPPTDRDESSFAQASKQMIETGNYTDIRLQKEPRYKKPIGIYWLQSSAVRLLNPKHLNEIWAYRVPSFLGASIAVLMTAALGALLFTPESGLLAAIMLASCILLNVEARLAKTDAALLASIVTAMYGLANAWRSRQESGKKLSLPDGLLFWTALAIGILIKGPIVLLPILSVLLWLRISDKNIRWFRSLRPALGLPYALLLIAPWFIAISMQSHGAFMQQSAGNDMLAKIWQGQDRGMIPPGAHLMLMPILFFPFSLFVAFAAPDIWKNRREPAVKFCLGWIVPTWIVFEISLTKLPHYVLPAYPAIALLTGKFVIDGLPTIAASKRRFPLILTVGFWVLLGAGIAFVFSAIPFAADAIVNIPQIVAGVLLVLLQIVALVFLRQQKLASLVILAGGMMIFAATTFGYSIPRLQHVWMSREIVSAADRIKPCPQSQIVSAGYREPSLAFLAGTDTLMETNGTSAAEDLKQDSCRVVAITAKHSQEFIDAFAGAAQQPQAAATINGLNSGHGAETALTLYILRKAAP